MKRFCKRILILVFLCAVLCSIAGSASAAEIKKGVGVVQAQGGLRLRAQPDLCADVLTVAENGDTVVVFRKVGDWYLVNYNLHIGYMYGDYLAVSEQADVSPGVGAAESEVMNVAPGAGSAILRQLSAGETVEILGFDSGRYRIASGSPIGYIRGDLSTLPEKKNGGASAREGASAESTGNSIAVQVAEYAKDFVGYPYVYGGSSPAGFDCSGFMQYVFAHFGYTLHRTATAQLADGYAVEYDELRPGDIVYFGYGSTATHVGMYLGDGQFVHAQNSRTGVVISSLSDCWYADSYLCAHRIVG